jgi:hypothetical protein
VSEDYSRIRPEDARPDEWDAALRLSDRIANHLQADREGVQFQWIAARLSDGGADPDTVYATREDAIARQLHSRYYAYVRISPMGMSPRAAWRFMLMTRSVFRFWRNPLDVEGQHVILPARAELAAKIAPRAFRGFTS